MRVAATSATRLQVRALACRTADSGRIRRVLARSDDGRTVSARCVALAAAGVAEPTGSLATIRPGRRCLLIR